MKSMRTLMAVLLLSCAAMSGAWAQEDEDAAEFTEEDVANAITFAMGDAIYTMYHEIGHMLVNELGIPVLGKEEDAVDTLAVLTLLHDDSDENSYISLIDAADGWYFNAITSTGSGVDDFSYYSAHSFDIQRAYNMVCLMVGADPEYFSDNADFYELDQDRRDGCVGTYEEASAAWNKVLDPFRVEDEQGAPIEIVYEDAGDYEYVEAALTERQLIEHAAELVMNNYVLPRAIIFRVTQCGEANAYYSSEGEVIYCYEMGDAMAQLYLTQGRQFYEGDEDEAESDDE